MTLEELKSLANKDVKQKPDAALVLKWDTLSAWALSRRREAKAHYRLSSDSFRDRVWMMDRFPGQLSKESADALNVVAAARADVVKSIESMRDTDEIASIATRMASLTRLRFEGVIDRSVHTPRPQQTNKSRK